MDTSFNPSFSFFSSATATTPAREADLLDTLAAIKEGAYKTKVEAIRALTEKAEQDVLKKKLPGVTWSGTFSTRRKDKLLQHSGLLCHDFDDLAPDRLQSLCEQLANNPYVYASFISPRGNGLKVLFRAPDIDDSRHEQRWEALGKHLAAAYGIAYDVKCRDVSRLCFLSYDPELYHNPDAEVILQTQFDEWERQFAPAPPKPAAQPKKTVADPKEKKQVDLYQKCHEIVQKSTPLPVNGGYNNYTNLYALQANRYGISETECWNHLESTFAFPAYKDQRP